MLRVLGLMLALTLVLVLTGGALFGREGAVLFFVIAAVMNFITYWFSHRFVLRMYKAKVIERDQAPELYDMVERLSEKAGIPMPVVAISDKPQPNAFATGRNPENAVVCFTQGILQALSPRELEGVAAHELAHIKNRHMLIGTVAATLAGAIAMVGSAARWGALGGSRSAQGNPLMALIAALVAPIAAVILQMAISRGNEFDADRSGAEITGDPMALASALETMELYARQSPMRVNPAGAAVAIVNPFGGASRVASWFRTHPPTRDRVAELKRLAMRLGRA